MFKGKKYVDSAKLIDRSMQYEVADAMDLVVKTATAKFDETIEVHVKLGVDSRHADQQVRGAIVLPNFDVVVASPDMMGIVGRLGKVLGPKGLMPSPKAGTVTPNVGAAVKEIKAGKIEYRLDKTNIIHCPIGKASFGPEKLTENFNTLIGAIIKAKPAAAKGQYIRSCVLASTMGPGVKVAATKL